MILDLFGKEIAFENIQGYDDVKDIVKRALDAEDNCNFLFIPTFLYSNREHFVGPQ
jgi:hypothetical protein